jgi:hypothetical protein
LNRFVRGEEAHWLRSYSSSDLVAIVDLIAR